MGNLATNGTAISPDFLRQLIRTYKLKHIHETTRSLAEKVNIPRSTLNKLENGQKKFNLEETIKILAGLGEKLKVVDALTQFSSDLKELWEDSLFLGGEGPSKSKEKETLISHLIDSRYFELLMPMTIGSGLSEDYIKRQFGDDGFKRVSELIEKKIVVKRSDSIYEVTYKSFLKLDQNVLNSLFIHSLKTYYKPYPVTKDENLMCFRWLTCDKKRVNAVFAKEMRSCFKRLLKRIQEPEFSGDDKVFIGMAFDTIS